MTWFYSEGASALMIRQAQQIRQLEMENARFQERVAYDKIIIDGVTASQPWARMGGRSLLRTRIAATVNA